MKLVTFLHQDQERIGAVDNSDRIVDLHRAYGSYLRQSRIEPRRRSIGGDCPRPRYGRILKTRRQSFDAARKALAHARARRNADTV